MGRGCLTRRGSVQASAGGCGVNLSLFSTRNECGFAARAKAGLSVLQTASCPLCAKRRAAAVVHYCSKEY